MSQSKEPAIEVQKKTAPARQPEQEVTRQPDQGPVQQVAPQAAYRRAQINRNGLRAVDVLALQHMVGNRVVRWIVTPRLSNTNCQPHSLLVDGASNAVLKPLRIQYQTSREESSSGDKLIQRDTKTNTHKATKSIEKQKMERKPPLGLPGEGIAGPLATGTQIKGEDWEISQNSPDDMILRIDQSQLEIHGSKGEAYGYYLEPRKVQTQQVIYIVRTQGVTVNKRLVPDSMVSLIVHERQVGNPGLTQPGLILDVLELPNSQGGVLLNLDDSFISITIPRQVPGFLPGDFPTTKFAYYIDPEWSGEDGKQKRIHIVATPGVVVESGTHSTTRDLGQSFDLALFASGYGRILVPNLVRIQEPDRVPKQGEPFDADEFLQYKSYFPGGFPPIGEPRESPIGVFSGTSGVTIRHEWSGAIVTLRASNPAVGARFAYEIVPPTPENLGEIRAVVGPGVIVELSEPAPLSWRKNETGPLFTPTPPPGKFEPGESLREERVDVTILEIPNPAQVPSQGSPINSEYYYSIGGSRRKPNKHEYLSTSEIPYLLTDVAIGFIPVFGDIVDIGEFLLALFTDKDKWRRPVTTTDKILMGLGALVGLIPFVGEAGKLLRKGGPAVVKLADLAGQTGKTVEQLEVMIAQMKRVVSPADASSVRRAEAMLRASGEIATVDVEMLSRISKDLGAVSLPPSAIHGPVVAPGTPKLPAKVPPPLTTKPPIEKPKVKTPTKTSSIPPKQTAKPKRQLDVESQVKAAEKLKNTEEQITEKVASIRTENEAAERARQQLKVLADPTRAVPDGLKSQIAPINKLKNLEDKIEAIDELVKTSKSLTDEERVFLQWRKRTWSLKLEVEQAEETSRHLAKNLDDLTTAKKVAIEELREASKDLIDIMRRNGPNYRAKSNVSFDEVMPRALWDAIPPPKPALATDHLVALDRITKMPELNELLALYTEASSALKIKIKGDLEALGDIQENLVRMNHTANSTMKSNKSWNDLTYDQAKSYGYSADDVKKMRSLENKAIAVIQQKITQLTSQYRVKVKGSVLP